LREKNTSTLKIKKNQRERRLSKREKVNKEEEKKVDMENFDWLELQDENITW
jgi:hypothetical protein